MNKPFSVAEILTEVMVNLSFYISHRLRGVKSACDGGECPLSRLNDAPEVAAMSSTSHLTAAQGL